MSYNPSETSSPKFVARPTEDSFIPALSAVLTHLITFTPYASDGKTKLTKFHGAYCPLISIKDYLNRIAKYFRCSNECFVLSLVYIDRIVKLHDGFVVNCLNIHRLLVTSVMLAAKFFDDKYCSNAFYARVGGVAAPEMNILEGHFLSLINYQLYVSPEEYDQYRQNVEDALRPSSSIHPIAAPLVIPLNQDYSDPHTSGHHNCSQENTPSRKSKTSHRHGTSPRTSSSHKRNGIQRNLQENYHNNNHHPPILINHHLAPDPTNQVYRMKKEDESMAPAFFNNVNSGRINQETYPYHSNNFTAYEMPRRHVNQTDDATILKEVPEERYRDLRTSQNSIGYR